MVVVKRGKNNAEKQLASELRKAGFTIFWDEPGVWARGWYATHPKLICQYHVKTMGRVALKDLQKKTGQQTRLEMI